MKITINTDTSAFQNGNKGFEIARILRFIAKQVEENSNYEVQLRDINGNIVGKVEK